MYDILELNKKLVPELRDIAKELNIKRVEAYKKQDLIYKILDTQAIKEAEKKVKKESSPDQQEKKEERSSFKNFLRKKQEPEDKPVGEKARRGRRPRRDYDDNANPPQKMEIQAKKPNIRESNIQSRQDQIKAIIQGFTEKTRSNRDESAVARENQPKEPEKPKIVPQEPERDKPKIPEPSHLKMYSNLLKRKENPKK
jgi:transcription termination factor Rho